MTEITRQMCGLKRCQQQAHSRSPLLSPARAYFPEERIPNGPVASWPDKAREAVRQMYGWLIDVTASLHPHFQLIVTDQADLPEPWFNDVVVERWRGGEALVPPSWVGRQQQPEES